MVLGIHIDKDLKIYPPQEDWILVSGLLLVEPAPRRDTGGNNEGFFIYPATSISTPPWPVPGRGGSASLVMKGGFNLSEIGKP